MSSKERKSKDDKDTTMKAGSSTKKVKLDDIDGSEYLRRKHNFIRSTIRTDYQPDICKDYKNTGFCGFGDSCKFLHDRSDYKAGWQIEEEWKKGEYQEDDDNKYLIDNEDSNDDEDKLQRCAVCEKSFVSPVVLKCKHIFCESCAEKVCLDKCFTCDKPTKGIFKNASKLVGNNCPK